MSDVPTFDITAVALSDRVAAHFGYRRPFDFCYSIKPTDEKSIELFASTFIHPAQKMQVDRIREGLLSANLELVLRVMVRDGVLQRAVYRVAI